MISPQFVDMLRCPEDGSRLTLADEPVIRRLNSAVAAGSLKNRGGQLVSHSLDGGLVRADGKILYPIVDQIPIMLVDEAIALT